MAHKDPMMSPWNGGGRKPAWYIGRLKQRTGSILAYSGFAGLMFLYFTDWELFMGKVPFYRGKFEKKEPIV